MGWAHFSDIGGLRAGSISPDTTDIFQEGIIVPPTKLVDAGRHQRGDAADLLPQLALPRAERGRHARADGERRRWACGASRRSSARFGPDVVADALAPAAGAHARPRARQARRDLRLRHASLHRRDRFRRPWQRPVPSSGLALTRERGPTAGPLHLRRHRDRRPVAGAGQLADESRRARHGARRCSISAAIRRQVCNAGGPQALDEVRLREGSLLWPRFPAPLGMRGLTLMRVLAARERPHQRRRRQGAGGAFGLRHLLHARHLPRRRGRARAVPDVRRHRRRLGRAALRRRHRCGLFRGAGELSRSSSSRLGYPVRLRTYGILATRRRRAAIAAAAASCASTSAGRGGGAGDPHRQRGEPALGHRRRHGGRRRARRRQSRHQRTSALLAPLSRRQRAAGAATSCASRPAAAAATAIPSTGRPSGAARTCSAASSAPRRARGITASRHRRGRGRPGATTETLRARRPEAKRFHRHSVCRLPSPDDAAARRRHRYRRHLHRHRPCTTPASGRIWRAKTPIVPADPSQAFLDRRAAGAGRGRARRAALGRVLHGTTVATNMILEGKGARDGAGDHRRLPPCAGDRPPGHPAPRQHLRLGQADAAGAGLAHARGQGAHRRRRHGARAARRGERARQRPRPAARSRSRRSRSACCTPSPTPRTSGASPSILREALPGVAVTASSDVLPVVREYERSLATILNASVMPGGVDLRLAAGAAPRRAKDRGAAPAHAVERRRRRRAHASGARRR